MMYWIEWIENGVLKSYVAEGFVEWADKLETLYQQRFEYVSWKAL
ncbi:hypothetical protein OEJ84_23660 (plasmid) [Bacillus subtilis]|nr:hypothetical protein OEJ84_23660 [Bacillus subtilis]